MRAISSFMVLTAALHLASPAVAHLQLTSPAARYVQNDSGLKTSPCGSGSATRTVTKLIPGQVLSVTWKESVPHGGHYRIALSAKESDFVAPTSLAVAEPRPAWVLADGIADQPGTRTYTETVKLPEQECPACVLQLIQVMSSGTDGTNSGSFSGVYYACADLAIAAANGDGGAVAEVAAADAVVDRLPDGPDARSGDAAGDRAADSALFDQARGGAGGSATSSGAGGSGGSGGSGAGGAGRGGTGGSAAGGSTPFVGSTAGAAGGGGATSTVASGGVAASNGGAGSGGADRTTTSTGTGGSGAAPAGVGAGGAGTPVHASSGPGCSCSMGGPTAVALPWPVLGALALGFAVALRRRHPRPNL